MGQDYYSILGLTRSAADADIKKALVTFYDYQTFNCLGLHVDKVITCILNGEHKHVNQPVKADIVKYVTKIDLKPLKSTSSITQTFCWLESSLEEINTHYQL